MLELGNSVFINNYKKLCKKLLITTFFRLINLRVHSAYCLRQYCNFSKVPYSVELQNCRQLGAPQRFIMEIINSKYIDTIVTFDINIEKISYIDTYLHITYT